MVNRDIAIALTRKLNEGVDLDDAIMAIDELEDHDVLNDDPTSDSRDESEILIMPEADGVSFVLSFVSADEGPRFWELTRSEVISVS